ncbi:DUF4434 domain-containing protein [Paraburkholderia acidisoli]|uniref:DUF4434 domain-containing protein n=1 Tax=Paraburkholderia acidisoli TaxID=2571748 RepID=A0A7Z2GPV6_9BURK|nr:DUF4434 domain-containing protein [Paraburkholderia acidisoli]
MQAAALAACLPLAACESPVALAGTFVQLWREHLDWSREQWQSRLAATRKFGCTTIFVQWVAIDTQNSSENHDWAASDTLLQGLLDDCAQLGITVHLGLPYDDRWWQVIGAADVNALDAFLASTAARATAWMRAAAWPRHRAFGGWYVPYEIEQYSWADAARAQRLATWLHTLAEVAKATSTRAPTLSTYHSRLAAPHANATLDGLWRTLLAHADVHPMIQDGAGAEGLGAYTALQPLHDLFVAQGVPFDLIVELFENVAPHGAPPQNGNAGFAARAATYARVQAQWKIARDYGAQRVVAFALDPYVIGDAPGAHALRDAWRSALR